MQQQLMSIEQRSIAQQVFVYIKRRILSGEYKMGQRIAEENIAQELNVSRTPIREAIRNLENYGLVRIKPRSFVEVACFDEADAGKISCIRAEIETLAVTILSEKAGNDDRKVLMELVDCCEKAAITGIHAEIFEKDSELHLEIARRTENQYLFDILERLDAKIQLYRISKCTDPGKISAAVGQHRAIIGAVLERNGEKAAQLMREHIRIQKDS